MSAISKGILKQLARANELRSSVVAEVRKHWLASAALAALCFYAAPAQTVELGILLGMALIASRHIPFLWWARSWSKRLTAAGQEVPKLKELRPVYKTLTKRSEMLARRWPELCIMHGLHDRKRTPWLADLEPTLELDFKARIPRTGFDPDDIKAKSAKLAKGLGCGGGITVRETSVGSCDITFNWTNPIRRPLPLRELQMPLNGGIAFGHTEFGGPAELRIDASKTFVGVQGSGKSVGAEAALADLVRRGVYVRLRISNPKKNEMRMFSQFVKQSMGRLEVRAYAETEADNLQLVKDAVNAMEKRSQSMKGRKLVEPTRENPLDILWLDEMMMLPKDCFKNGPFSPLGQILVAGRASLNVVWGCTQMFYASEFGSLRGLFDERILMRVKTQIQNDMVIEDATKRGALAHRIHPSKEKGVGYIEDEHGELTKFRAAKVEDEDLERIIRGQVPEGMITQAARVEAPEQRVYFIEAQGTDLVKIGIAAVPADRLRELQTASPHKLSIITTTPGGRELETRLHRRFAASRASGEWFHRTPELDALIAGAALPPSAVRHPRLWAEQKHTQRLEAVAARPAGPDFLPWEPKSRFG